MASVADQPNWPVIRSLVQQWVRAPGGDSLTIRTIRDKLETDLDLATGALAVEPHRENLRNLIDEIYGEQEQEQEQEQETEIARNDKENSNEDDADDFDDEDEVFVTKKKSNVSTSAGKQKQKNETSQSNKKRSPVASSRGSAKDTHIENLKKYIHKCGVRKIWSKELNGMTPPQQVLKLQAILDELGMKGRPTLEKCAKIKEEREQLAELNSLSTSNILSDSRRRTAVETVQRLKAVVRREKTLDASLFEEGGEDEDDIVGKRKKRSSTKKEESNEVEDEDEDHNDKNMDEDQDGDEHKVIPKSKKIKKEDKIEIDVAEDNDENVDDDTPAAVLKQAGMARKSEKDPSFNKSDDDGRIEHDDDAEEPTPKRSMRRKMVLDDDDD